MNYLEIIRGKVKPAAQYEQLAEELGEAQHEALKMARILRGDNPTPDDPQIVCKKLVEELSDVDVCVSVLGVKPSPGVVARKTARWASRVQGIRI